MDPDDGWERAEEADYRATRRRESEDRARLMDASEPVPYTGKCLRCGGKGTLPPRYWKAEPQVPYPCPACQAVTP